MMNSRNLHCLLTFSLFIFNIPELVSQLMSSVSQEPNHNIGGVHQLFGNKTFMFFTRTHTNDSQLGQVTQQSITAVSTQGQTEDSIQLSKLSKDQDGHWVYNPWPVTFGHRLLDTRFTKIQPYVHINVASNPKQLYNPKVKLSTVCMGSTIPHGKFKVINWIDRHIYRHKHTSQAFYMNLRRDLYTKGQSEICHNKKYNKWIDFQKCALKRHQRLEAFIPKYPLHQLIKEKT